MEEKKPKKLKNVERKEDLENEFLIFENNKGHLSHFTRDCNFEKYENVSELHIFTFYKDL